MRREQKAEKRRKERPESNRARARYTRGKGKRERERKYTSDFSYLFLLLFFFKGVVVWLTFSLFFAQIWVHKLKRSRVSRKERFLRDIKFKHFGIPKDIHHSNAERCS